MLWGVLGVFSKGLLDVGVSPLEIAFWRALLGGGAFVLHAALTRRLLPRSGADLASFAGFAVVGVALFFTSLNLAIDAGGISLAFILLYSAPLFVTLLAWLLLGEPLTGRKALLAGVAVAGVALVSLGGGQGIRVSLPSVAWGLTAGLAYSTYYIFGKWALARYHPVTIYALILPLGALLLSPLVRFAPKSPTAWLLLALIALVSTYLAYLLYYLGLGRVEASRAVLVATIEPVVAAALAAALFGERFGPLGLVGSVLVLGAAALASLPGRAGPARGGTQPLGGGAPAGGGARHEEADA